MNILKSYLSSQAANPPEMYPQWRLVNVRIEEESIFGTTGDEDASLFYNPFESYKQEPGKGNAPRPVHLEFADLNPTDRYEAARQFIEKYGPLVSRFPYIRFKTAEYYPLFYRQSLRGFWRMQQCFAATVKLVQEIDAGKTRREVLGLMRAIEEKCSVKHMFPLEALSDENIRSCDVASFLISHITDYLKDVHPVISFLGPRVEWIRDPIGGLAFHIMPKRRGLLSICYLMLAWDLCENRKIATCKNEMCRRRYLRLPVNKLFCSSECAAKTAKREWARRQRERGAG